MSTAVIDAPENGCTPRLRHRWEPRAARTVMTCGLAAGITTDVAIVHGPASMAGSGAVVIAVAGLVVVLTSSRRLTSYARLWISLTVAIAPWLALRMSPWLIGPDAVAIGAMLVLAVCEQPLPTFSGVVGAGVSMAAPSVHAVSDAPQLVRDAFPSGKSTDRTGAFRGIALAAPVAVLVLALLASGDRFFGSFLSQWGIGSWVRHVVLSLLAALSFFALVLRSREAAASPRAARPPLLTRRDAGFLLAALTGVLATYVASTIAAATAGAEYVERRTGLTYAEYARSGFFQLVGVVVIVVSVLLCARPHVGRGDRALLATALSLVTLAVCVVAESIARLGTYRDAYGLTMLRLSTTVFAAWLGFVLVVVAITFVWDRAVEQLVIVVLASAAVVLLGWNATNPEAIVARSNIARLHDRPGEHRVGFDGDYLTAQLSDDALPTIVARLDQLAPADRTAVLSSICAHATHGETGRGLAWNASRSAAAASRRRVCQGG